MGPPHRICIVGISVWLEWHHHICFMSMSFLWNSDVTKLMDCNLPWTFAIALPPQTTECLRDNNTQGNTYWTLMHAIALVRIWSCFFFDGDFTPDAERQKCAFGQTLKGHLKHRVLSILLQFLMFALCSFHMFQVPFPICWSQELFVIAQTLGPHLVS